MHDFPLSSFKIRRNSGDRLLSNDRSGQNLQNSSSDQAIPEKINGNQLLGILQNQAKLEALGPVSDQSKPKRTIPKEGYGLSDMYEINDSMEDDLVLLMNNYVEMFTEYEGFLKKQVISSESYNFEKEELEAQLSNLKAELLFLEREAGKSEENYQMLFEDSEERLYRIKDELSMEKATKANLLKKIDEMNEKLSTKSFVAMHEEEELKDLQIKYTTNKAEISRMKGEIDLYKSLMLSKEIQEAEEAVDRESFAKATRRMVKFTRINWVGNPKPIQEILVLLSNIKLFPLNSIKRLISLEDICVFLHANIGSLEKIRAVGGVYHCIQSLYSTDKRVVLRALHIIFRLIRNSEKSVNEVINNNGVAMIRKYMLDTNENIQVEALACIELLVNFPHCHILITRNGGLATLMTLADEGMQSKTKTRRLMALMSLKSIKRLAQNSILTRSLLDEGVSLTCMKAINMKDKNLRQLGSEILALMAIHPLVRKEIADLNPIEEIILLMKTEDRDIQINACKLLVNIIDNEKLREHLLDENIFEELLFLLGRTEDIGKKIIFKVISSLCIFPECAEHFLKIGILHEITSIMRSMDSEVRRYCSETLRNVVSFSRFYLGTGIV